MRNREEDAGAGNGAGCIGEQGEQGPPRIPSDSTVKEQGGRNVGKVSSTHHSALNGIVVIRKDGEKATGILHKIQELAMSS